MPDQSYTSNSDAREQRGEGLAADLKAARDLQSALPGLSRKDALASIREDRNRRQIVQAMADARPSFLKDGHGIRGPQPDGANKLEIAGADGSGRDLQVKPRASSSATTTTSEDEANAGTTITAVIHLRDPATGALAIKRVTFAATIANATDADKQRQYAALDRGGVLTNALVEFIGKNV